MIVAGGFLLGAIVFAQLSQPIHKVFDPLQVEGVFSVKQLFSAKEKDAVPQKAPDLRITTLDGQETSLKELAGQNRAVVINFWATWCSPCLKEMPYFEKIHRDYQKEGVVVLGIAEQEATREVKRFVTDRSLTYRIGVDPQKAWGAAFGGVNVLPTTVFLDGSRRISRIHTGYLTERELRKTLDDLLSK